MLCDYKNIFGEPGTGIHSYRLFNIAIVDLLVTIVAAIVISEIFKCNMWIVLLAVFLLGIFVHRLFCVNTTVNQWVFGTV